MTFVKTFVNFVTLARRKRTQADASLAADSFHRVSDELSPGHSLV